MSAPKKKPSAEIHAQRQRRDAQKRREETLFTIRALGSFGAIVLIVAGLALLRPLYEEHPETGRAVLLWSGLPLLGAGLILSLLTLWRAGAGRAPRHALVLSGLASLALGALSLAAGLWGPGMADGLYIILPILVALYLFYYLYQREFFYLLLLGLGGAGGLWALNRLVTNPSPLLPPWAAVVISGLSPALVCLALVWLRRGGGVIRLARFRLTLLHPAARYRFLFIACGILLLSVASILVWGWDAAWYASLGMLCYLFVMAVYYTVCLM